MADRKRVMFAASRAEKNPDDVAPVGYVRSGSALPPCPLTDRAARIIILSDGQKGCTTAQAMKIAGFSPAQCKNRSIQKRVNRHKNKLLGELSAIDEPMPIPTTICTTGLADTTMTVSTITNPSSLASSVCNSNTVQTTEDNDEEQEEMMFRNKSELKGGDSISTSNSKRRRTANQLQRDLAERQVERQKREKAFLLAAKMYEAEQELPFHMRRSARKICNIVNEQYGTNISPVTVRKRVAMGLGNLPPRFGNGRPPTLSIVVESALISALVTYVHLSCANMKEKPNRKKLINLIGDTIAGPCCSLTDPTALYRRLQPRYATLVKVNTGNYKMEERRAIWTTYNNLNAWFDSLKAFLIEKGFARKPTVEEINAGHAGELFFEEGQLNRILNIDETGVSLNGTEHISGGRPVTQYGPADDRLSSGVDRAHKSGYRCTFIAGSTVAGDPIPAHFQLKSTAKEDASKRIHTEFLKYVPKIRGVFGHGEVVELGLTINCNATAGMDQAEFSKYLRKSIVPLFPNADDVPGKRVLLIVDSGPGRNHEETLAFLRVRGFYLFPSVPNTTHVSQATDRNYGPFKSIYRQNLKLLADARRTTNRKLHVSDIPLMIFGGKDSGVTMRSAFEEAFAVEKSKKIWETIGINPYSRRCLHDSNVAHQLIVRADGMIDVDADPQTVRLLELQKENEEAVSCLKRYGFNGDVFSQQAPKNYGHKKIGVTVKNSKERQDALANAKSHGEIFIITGGDALNSNDYFIGLERKRRQKQVQELKLKKKAATDGAVEQTKMEAVIEKYSCGGKKDLYSRDVVQSIPITSLKIMYKWKLGKNVSSGMKKADIVAAWLNAKDVPRTKCVEWSDDEEALLTKLETEEVQIKDTELGKQQAIRVEESLAVLRNADLDTLLQEATKATVAEIQNHLVDK